MKNRGFLIVSSVILMSFLLSCAGNVKPTRQIDDAILATNVHDALAADRDLGRYDFTVDAKGSTVTIIGVVSQASQRDRVEAIAMSVAGVEKVDNRVEIRR